MLKIIKKILSVFFEEEDFIFDCRIICSFIIFSKLSSSLVCYASEIFSLGPPETPYDIWWEQLYYLEDLGYIYSNILVSVNSSKSVYFLTNSGRQYLAQNKNLERALKKDLAKLKILNRIERK